MKYELKQVFNELISILDDMMKRVKRRKTTENRDELNKNSKIQMQHAVQQHKLQNAICCPSILTVIIKTKILSFLNMHLVYCVDKTKLQFTSPLILFFSSLFLTASQSICVQRERGNMMK